MASGFFNKQMSSAEETSLQRKSALTTFLSLAGATEPSALAQRFLVAMWLRFSRSAVLLSDDSSLLILRSIACQIPLSPARLLVRCRKSMTTARTMSSAERCWVAHDAGRGQGERGRPLTKG